MLSRPKRGPRGPHIQFIRDSDQPIRLDEARLAAWALAIGQRRDAGRPMRPHRGKLPDIDVSLAQPAVRQAGLMRRILRWLAGRSPAAGAAAEPAVAEARQRLAPGEVRRTPYIWVNEAEPETGEPDDNRSAPPALAYNHGRTA